MRRRRGFGRWSVTLWICTVGFGLACESKSDVVDAGVDAALDLASDAVSDAAADVGPDAKPDVDPSALPHLAAGNHAGMIVGFNGSLPTDTAVQVEARWEEAVNAGMKIGRVQVDWDRSSPMSIRGI